MNFRWVYFGQGQTEIVCVKYLKAEFFFIEVMKKIIYVYFVNQNNIEVLEENKQNKPGMSQ